MAAQTPPSEDWTELLTDRIVTTVDTVRDKTTVQAVNVARAVVYGLLGVLVGITVLGLLLVFVMRGLHILVSLIPLAATPEMRRARAVWIVDLGLGIIFTLSGVVLLRKARRAASADSNG